MLITNLSHQSIYSKSSWQYWQYHSFSEP